MQWVVICSRSDNPGARLAKESGIRLCFRDRASSRCHTGYRDHICLEVIEMDEDPAKLFDERKIRH